MAEDKVYGADEIRERIATELPRWSLDHGHLCRTYRTAGWKGTLMAVNAVGHLAEIAWHHPDLEVAYDRLTVKLVTHSAGGVTDKDFALALKIEEMLTWRPGPDSALEGTPDDPRYQYVRAD